MHKTKAIRSVAALVLGLTIAGMATMPGQAHPTAKIEIDITQGGFVIGGTSGHGYVRYHRRNYPITISGMRFGAIIGATNAQLAGRITNLSSLDDVEGTYVSIGASASLGSGKNYQQFKNERGVHLELYGFQDGVEMSLDLGGMTIRLAN
ncbi:MAG: hypothetical protein V2I51_00955 [Anderseniella sp.]|jgi:hypothetical protein|nr:hypothetical protein [Anderseniella sp.]